MRLAHLVQVVDEDELAEVEVDRRLSEVLARRDAAGRRARAVRPRRLVLGADPRPCGAPVLPPLEPRVTRSKSATVTPLVVKRGPQWAIAEATRSSMPGPFEVDCKRVQSHDLEPRCQTREPCVPGGNVRESAGAESAIDCRMATVAARRWRGEPMATTDLVVGTFTPSVLLDLARSTGRLARAGITASPVPVTSSPAQFRSLLEGEHDVALTSPDNVLAYRFSPSNPLGAVADVRIVSAVDRGMGLGLYAASRSRSRGPSRRRGRGRRADSGFALALYALLESRGLNRDDYELAKLGATPRRLEALLDGGCDVTMLNAGNELVAEQRGCTRLAGVHDVCAPYLGTVLAVAGDSRLPEATALARH